MVHRECGWTRYLGICGGAFIAARRYVDHGTAYRGLGLVPADARDYIAETDARLLKVNWLRTDRMMYYQAGPTFDLSRDAGAVTEIARYEDGSVAAFEAALGKGKVIVTGVHPEADGEWLREDGISARGWTPTMPLAVSLLRLLLEP